MDIADLKTRGVIMLNCALFHSQIASIVEVLAKTAIAEICELVDNGYAALQTEISRSQKENKALKRELQTTKQRLAQQEKKNGSPQASVNTGYRRVKICDELRGIEGSMLHRSISLFVVSATHAVYN